jgi:D-3-phosphoglycerate dehydrogenase
MTHPILKVSGTSFCKNKTLKRELLEKFPNSLFHSNTGDLDENQLMDFLSDAEIAIVGTEKITPKVLSACPKLKFISKYGVGVDNIDFKALEKHQIEFGFMPGVNRLCVAELTLGFMLGLAHNFFTHGFSLKHGTWIKDGGFQLSEKTIGIIGLGNVGGELLRLLQPFRCDILINDIVDKSHLLDQYQFEQVSLDHLLKNSDLVTLHVPLDKSTLNLINSEQLSVMKNSAFLINASRGKVVNELDLKQALDSKTIAGAALDVFSKEPPTDLNFLSTPNLMVTPHIGGGAKEAKLNMGRAAISHIVKYLQD